ncbi:hypothetical protein, partial [Escherichia coli]|uniref:hypothetical protein n=1 Tax=Escherichia coli TaxID=562 RepID=UPI003D32AD10
HYLSSFFFLFLLSMPPGSVITVAKTANCLFYGTLTGLLLGNAAVSHFSAIFLLRPAENSL